MTASSADGKVNQVGKRGGHGGDGLVRDFLLYM
jgi:hypothetical protein